MTRISAAVALALVLTVAPAAQQPPPLRGSWSATVGTSRVLRGTWSATIDSATSDRGRGTWVLLDDGNRVALHGTWTAEKSARGWEGTWSARSAAKAGRGASGRTVSGTWRADIEDPNVRTLTEMLQHAVVDQVSGTWRRGASSGGWRLQN